MIRILLLVPKGNGPAPNKKWNQDWPPEIEEAVSRNLWKTATLGPLVLGAIAIKKNCEVDFVEEEYEPVDTTVHYDIAAMYTVTPNINKCYAWCEFYKLKGTHTVLGGVHASVCSEEAADYADTLLVGEAENIWCNFLDDYIAGKAKKLYLQPLGKIDVTKSPVPAYALLPQKLRKIVPLQTARGCPHGCKFCNLRSLYGKGYRPKAVDQIEGEIKEILSLNPNAVVYITDDNFFSNSYRATQLMKILKAHKINWYAHMDISFGANKETIKLASQCGCKQILVGFESIEADNLKNIDENDFKFRQFENYATMIASIQNYGIGVIGSFIVGLEHDTADTFRKTAEFIKKTKLYGASITVNTPYPGTEFFEEMKKEERILTLNWDMYTIFQPVIKPRNMTLVQFDAEYRQLLLTINSPEAVAEKIDYFKKIIKNKESRIYDDRKK